MSFSQSNGVIRTILGGFIQNQGSFMSLLLGAVLMLSVFLFMGASKGRNDGRYQMTVTQDGMYVIDSTTGRIKVVKSLRKKWESGTTVLDWKTNYTELKGYKVK